MIKQRAQRCAARTRPKPGWSAEAEANSHGQKQETVGTTRTSVRDAVRCMRQVVGTSG